MKNLLSEKVKDVVDYLKAEIQSMPPGMPLPTVAEIRKKLGVSQISVQRACDVLEERGLIVRRRRKGMFVSNRTQTGEFAIVAKSRLLSHGVSSFYPKICNDLVDVLRNQRPDVMVKIYPGDPNCITDVDFAESLEVCRPEVMRGLRGVFSLHHLGEVADKLLQQDVPIVYLKDFDFPNVHSDNDAFRSLTLTHLKESGCKKIGIIGLHSSGSFCGEINYYRQEVEKLELELSDRWIVNVNPDCIDEPAGYQAFKEFWFRDDNRPDGILITDDVICRGVLRGLLHYGVKLPENLQLVTWSNEGDQFPYHKPVTRYENPILGQADRAVALMLGLLDGTMKEQAIRVPGRLIVGETTISIMK